MAPHEGYGQYCPISRAAEVLGERWTLLIVRDMLCGTTRFNELARGLPGLSRTLLAKRLRQLEAAGVVTKIESEYVLTEAGLDLHPAVFGLGRWGAKWQFGDPKESELDPEVLMWWAHRRIDFTVFPDRRIVLAFTFRREPRRFWIVKDAQGPSLCNADPGFDVDVEVRSELAAMYRVWLGKLELRTAMRNGDVQFTGSPSLVRTMPAALLLSPAAPLSSELRESA